MSIIAFIPARCGSKAIKLKNIKPFCGQPLIYWNIIALEASKSIDQIIVATDCGEIEDCVNRGPFSKVKVYRRDPDNAQDHSSTESVMLEYLDKHNLNNDDLFILVQATSPFTQTDDFDQAIKQYKEDSIDSLLTCTVTKHFFWSEDGQSTNYDYQSRPRRQDFQGNLTENGAFYISTVGNIIQYKNRLGGKIGIYKMPAYTLTEIDEEEDWIIAEQLMHRFILSEQKGLIPTDVKLFAMDVDGVLTDAGMYYSETGDELKKFNTRDGKGIELIRNLGIKTAIITSEDTEIVNRRAKKLKVDYVFQGKQHGGKLKALEEICSQEGIQLSQTAYIGDDINCYEALMNVGYPACPADALPKIKSIPGIKQLGQKGGEGVVRAFIEHLFEHQL